MSNHFIAEPARDFVAAGSGSMTMRVVAVLVALLTAPPLLANDKPVNWTELPAPYATPSASNPPRIIPQPASASLSVPAGFRVERWMEGLYGAPREMILGPGGEVIVSQIASGQVTVIVDGERHDLITGLNGPFGLALHGENLYVADTEAVRRYRYDASSRAVSAPEELIDVRAVAGGHSTRAILIDRDNAHLYLSIGSASNVSAGEPPMRAAINRYDLDGKSHEIFASGIRNAVGMALNPVTGQLWVSSHERDGLGDDLVPDFLTRVERGGFYGWPYAYIGAHEDPRRAGEAPELVARTLYPDVLLGGHVGAMDVMFYTGERFPGRYRNGCFVALHGSWNRSKRSGHKVVFIPFADGRPTGGPEDFVAGWMLGEDREEVWGRPVGLLQLADGSILISDDGAGVIWRVHYEGEQ
jgi:glucose/arabinose dehydrogenase